MIKIGMLVQTDDGQRGKVDKTSIATGHKLYRVNDRWFDRDGLTRLS